MNLVNHIKRQREFSLSTFGPFNGATGVLDHLKKELVEVEENPEDLFEWIDVIILAIDGALRSGFTAEEIAQALFRKQVINENREWPDWRTVEPGKAIEHVRHGE